MTVRPFAALCVLVATLTVAAALSSPGSSAVAASTATAHSSTKVDDTALGASPNHVSYKGFASEAKAADYGGSDHYSRTKGSAVTIHWRGVLLSIQGRTAPSFGFGNITTDLLPRTSVSWYTSGALYQHTLYTTPTLPLGAHTTKIVVAGRHAAKSSGNRITLDSFVVSTLAVPPPKAPVVVILMENLSYGSVVGNGSMPFLNKSLIPHSMLLTNYYAVAHPSLPNYDALTSGQMDGCGDGCPTNSFGQHDIFYELHGAGYSFASYNESMPTSCGQSTSYPYAPKHNPEVYYTDVAGTVCNATDLPLTSVNYSGLPRFSFVSPNLINDIHDGTPAQGDAWLSAHVPKFQAAGATVIVVFDEGTSSDTAGGGGHVFADISGAHVAAGTNGTSYNHFGLLRGLLNYFGLGCLGSSCSATPVSIP